MKIRLMSRMAVSVVCAAVFANAGELHDHRGPNQDGVFPARDYITDFSLGEKLILWKTLLPAEGQNTPIVVGDRVFLLCSNGLESDCPELFCLDIKSGSVLWKQPVDNLDALPPEQQAEAKALRKQELMLSHKARDFYFRFKELQARDPSGGKGVVITDQAAFDQLKTEARELGVLNEKWIEYHLSRAGNYVKQFPFSYLPLSQPNKEREAAYKKLLDNDWFRYEGWHYIESCYTGRTFPSPVSDGRHVYVFTQDGTAACFDLDGNRKWLVDAMQVVDGNSSLVTASPALIGTTLVVYHCMEAVAIETATGKVAWRHKTGISAAYSEAGTPVHLVVDGTDYLYLGSSQILRLSDGKQVGKIEPPVDAFPDKGFFRGYLGSHFDSIGRGDRMWLVEDTNGGGGRRPVLHHYAFRKDGERIVAEAIWHVLIEQSCVVMDGDRLHQAGLRDWQVLDPATGKEGKKGRGFHGTGDRYSVVTDKHFLALVSTDVGNDRSDVTWQAQLAKARTLKPAGTLLVFDKTTLAEVGRVEIPMEPPEGAVLQRRIARTASAIWRCVEGGNWGASSPLPWGNRVIVRNHDAVYCIGMPGTEYKAPEVGQ